MFIVLIKLQSAQQFQLACTEVFFFPHAFGYCG